jgi:hypothetical protein
MQTLSHTDTTHTCGLDPHVSTAALAPVQAFGFDELNGILHTAALKFDKVQAACVQACVSVCVCTSVNVCPCVCVCVCMCGCV